MPGWSWGWLAPLLVWKLRVVMTMGSSFWEEGREKVFPASAKEVNWRRLEGRVNAAWGSLPFYYIGIVFILNI